MAVIKIDIDGVIRDIVTPMCALYNKKYNENINPNEVIEYDVRKAFPKLLNDGIDPVNFFFIEYGKDVFYDGANLFYRASDAIKLLEDTCHEFIIVTHQIGIENRVRTLQFLEDNDIDADKIAFTDNKTLVYGDYLIDDNPDFLADEPFEARLMINRPYNQYYKEHCHKTFNSLYEAIKYVLKREKSKKYYI